MKQIYSNTAPAAIGPYCHAIAHNGMVFCSGQIPLNPNTMEISGSTIEEQTLQVMINIEAVLSELEIGLDKIVKTTIFLDNMEDFIPLNAVYEQDY